MMSYQKNLNLDAGARRQNVVVYKSTKNHKIFNVILTETLVCWVIRSWVIQVYIIHKSSQLLSVALSLVNFSSYSIHIQCIFKKYHYFWSNWLRSKFSLIYFDRGVKPDIFGDISVFSVFCWDASYLSWEASQQNFILIFFTPLDLL